MVTSFGKILLDITMNKGKGKLKLKTIKCFNDQQLLQ